MIKIYCEQGTDEWFNYRLGRITGTRFKALMAGEATQTYKDLITDLCGEIITQEAEETYSNALMERGKDLEPEARMEYAEMFGDVEEVGLCIPDEDNDFYEWIGVSPDGITEGLLEIKCPLRKTHLNYIEKNRLPNEYKWQVYGQLYVTGLPYCDFMSYYPGMKPFIIRVYPDDDINKEIGARIGVTIERVKEKLEMYNNYIVL